MVCIWAVDLLFFPLRVVCHNRRKTLLGNTQKGEERLCFFFSQCCAVLPLFGGRLQPVPPIRALDLFLHFLIRPFVRVCVCVCARHLPQLRLHLPSDSVCLTATGSHLWPPRVPPPPFPPSCLQSPTLLVSRIAPLNPSNPVLKLYLFISFNFISK